MRRMDARRLTPEAQEDLRRRVVYAVREDGMAKSLAARTFGVSRQSIDNWLARVDEAGPARGLAARKRGPKPRPRLRSEDPVGRTYSPRGKTPVVPAAGRRFGCNTISAISNLGRLWFMVFAGRFTAAVFVAFLGRLLRAVPGRKLVLIVDSHPVHKSATVRRWLAGPAAAGRIELVYLPGYSPELNPDELLNQDTKQAMR